MSQENMEPFRRFNAAFNRGDLGGAIALVDPPPEFEFVFSGVFMPELAGVHRGPEGLRRVAEVFWGGFDEPHVEIHEKLHEVQERIRAVDCVGPSLEAAGLRE